MTGGGLKVLVAYGAQNVILSGNPQMTYFYHAFRRYTHFSMENATVPLEGPNELSFDQPIRLRAKIPRIGDLLSDVYFSFRIPDIYSKYNPSRFGAVLNQQEFQWVRYLGAAIIQNAAFFVGGQKIHEFDGTYILAKATMDLDTDAFAKWKRLVGDVPELVDPAKGAYVGGTTRVGYPNVIKNPTTGTQLNRPSILGRDIHVPLSFWFSDAFSQSLPLVGLQYHECEVQLTLNPIEQLYTIKDISGYRVAPTFQTKAPLANINNNLPEYAAVSDVSGQIRYFFTDIDTTVPPLNGWFINPRLQCTYIYLPDEERKLFASKPLAYLMYQVTNYPFPGLFNRQTLDIYTHNPVARLIFVPRRSDAVNRNDFANFTNWYSYPYPPFNPTPGIVGNLKEESTSGLFIPNAQQDIIRHIRILCDGNEIQEEKPTDFFTLISPFKYCIGVQHDGPLPIYSFSLHSPGIQPSGSLNTSRVTNFQVEVDVWPLPSGLTYTYDLNIYVESMNWFEVASGMGGIKYAL